VDNVLTRIKKVQVRRAKPMDNCFFDPIGQLERVTCKLCGVALQGMSTYARELMKKGSEIIAVERQRLMPTTQYDNIRIILRTSDEGQAVHDTPICSRCKRDVMSLSGPKLEEVLEEIYCCDLHTWMQEEQLHEQEIPWEKVGTAVPVDVDRNI
jgi:hypothetical protein